MVNLFSKRTKFLLETDSKITQNGFSPNEMVVAMLCIGILATLALPLYKPLIEMAEVFFAEKYLLGAVKECQMGLINGENYPSYSLPPQSLGLDLITTRRFEFLFSGTEGECLSYSGGNILSASRVSNNQEIPIFSLNIDLVTGEKTSEGDVPQFIDWWDGFYSPLIQEGDPLLQ